MAWLLAGICAIRYVLTYLLAGPEASDVAPSLLLRWCGLVGGWWAAATFLLVQVGLGSLLAGRLPVFGGIRRHTPLGVLLLLVVGSFCSYSVLMVLAMGGLLYPVGGLAYVLGAALGAGIGLRQLARSWPGRRGPSRRRLLHGWALAGAAVILLAWLVPLVIQSLLPNSDWDGAAYHLPLAQQLFHGGFWALDPGYWKAATPGAAHLFDGLFQFIGLPQAIIPFNLLTTLLIVLAVYWITSGIAGRLAGTLAAGVCLTQSLLWEVGITVRTDTFMAFYFLLGLYALALWVQDRSRRGYLPVFGMAMGLMMGLKHISFVFVALAVLGLVAVLLFYRRDFRLVGRRALIVSAACIVLPSAFWYVRNMAVTGDPLYPLLGGEVYRDQQGQRVRVGPSLAAFLDRHAPDAKAMERELSSSPLIRPLDYLAQHDAHARQAVAAPPRLTQFWDVLLIPWRHGRKPLNTVNILLLPALLLPLVYRRPPGLLCYAIALGAFAVTGYQTFLARYVLAVVPLAAIGSGLVLRRPWGAILSAMVILSLILWRMPVLVEHAPWAPSLRSLLQVDAMALPGLLRAATAMVLAALSLLAGVGLFWRRGSGWLRYLPYAWIALMVVAMEMNARDEFTKTTDSLRPVQYLWAGESHADWIGSVGYNSVPAMGQVLRFVNKAVRNGRIGREATVMMVGEETGDMLPVPWLPDPSREGSRWTMEVMRADADLDRVAQNLWCQGVRYLLVNIDYFNWAALNEDLNRRQLVYNLYTLKRFRDRHVVPGQPVYASIDSGMVLLELADPGTAAGGQGPGDPHGCPFRAEPVPATPLN